MDTRNNRTVRDVVDDRAVEDDYTVVRDSRTASGRTIGARVVWYIIGFIIALIALRLVLLLLGANTGSGFVGFVYSLSDMFVIPFKGIFSSPSNGGSYLDSAAAVAIVVYLLIGWGLAKLFTLTSRRVDA